MHVNSILENVNSGLAVFRVGGCSIKVKDYSIRINYYIKDDRVGDCFI